MEWHYDEGYAILSMKSYVKKALWEFLHRTPTKPVYGSTKCNKPEFGKKIQYAENENKQPVNEKLKQKIQQVAGKFYILAEQSITLPCKR